jgi:hypothetical protein
MTEPLDTTTEMTADPSHPTHLDLTEEFHVGTSEFHASRREDELDSYFGKHEPSQLSEAQLAANRANAKLSTGPTTPEGRAISARNNFRHGLTQVEGDLILLETESKDEYSRALAEFQAEWQPVTATERDLVERLASRQWLRRRAMKLQLYYISPSDGQIIDHDRFNLYRRYEIQHERSYNKALNDLMRLRALRLREHVGFESQQRKNEEHKVKIRLLLNRETLQELALRTAQSRAALQDRKFQLALTAENLKNSPKMTR